ncbi:hypothetical protein PIB30_035397 [Stylosanthes scabra]|uniref:KIB1-4 beta-propeller domain-containing protein n=1 Tax=Stylosanthes scabra TaxID=79078 RepID=A0ABU6Z9X2_9FABA|nr:hypothetical protein [Stylosanthes scabra]
MDGIDRWSDIHQDLLKEISKQFHSYDDYIQLGLICKEWSLKLPKTLNGNQIPWLLLPEETFKNHCYEDEEIYHLMQLPVAKDETLDTHALKEEHVYHMMLPNMQKQNMLIRGSGHGWLVMVSISDGSIQMLNPFTNVSLDLPPISALPSIVKYQPDNHGDEYTFWDWEDRLSRLDSDNIHRYHIWKVIINSSPDDYSENFMAVAIFGQLNRLAFYKAGYKRWIEFPTRDRSFEDVIFFQEKIYAVNNYGQLYEFDTKTREGLTGGIHESTPPPNVRFSPYTCRYLFGCENGSLLMLVRHVGRPRKTKECETYKFDIFELKRSEKEWSKVVNLGNHILVIGYNSSAIISAVPFLSKGNQIWFADNQTELQSSARHPIDQDIGIFDLDDGSFQRILFLVKFFSPPVWFLP